MGRIQDFNAFRTAMNETLLNQENLVIRRFFALDSRAYEAGHLDTKTKELLGLVASMVLRCDDCILYHLIQCHEAGATLDELYEVFSIALVVGGSIVIPHLRRAVEAVDELYAS